MTLGITEAVALLQNLGCNAGGRAKLKIAAMFNLVSNKLETSAHNLYFTVFSRGQLVGLIDNQRGLPVNNSGNGQIFIHNNRSQQTGLLAPLENR